MTCVRYGKPGYAKYEQLSEPKYELLLITRETLRLALQALCAEHAVEGNLYTLAALGEICEVLDR